MTKQAADAVQDSPAEIPFYLKPNMFLLFHAVRKRSV